jgi:hypothetical protein
MREHRSVKLLAGDRRTREVRHWAEWLRRVPAIRRKFYRWSEDFDPFHSNEAASVAVLANSAAQAGYLAHTEYVALKRHASRGRPFRQGRCDLWVAEVAEEISWAFEVKQHFAAAGLRRGTFEAKLDRAWRDARDVDREEADRRVGCLVTVPRSDVKPDAEFIAHVDELNADADAAFRIAGRMGPVWLTFRIVD